MLCTHIAKLKENDELKTKFDVSLKSAIGKEIVRIAPSIHLFSNFFFSFIYLTNCELVYVWYAKVRETPIPPPPPPVFFLTKTRISISRDLVCVVIYHTVLYCYLCMK